MTGSATYDEASGMPFPDILNRYQALNDRDSMARAIAVLQARGEWNDDRSIRPEDFPPLTAAEHLELLALGEVIARHYRHPAQVHHAVAAGATWEEIAAATGSDPDQARQGYLGWAEGQHRLRQDFPGGTIGLGDKEYAAAVKAAGDPHPALAAAELTCPACGQSFQIPGDGGNMQDALDVIEAHAGAHPGHLRAACPRGQRRLAEVRAILAAFDWEFHDRQLALEAIERIVLGGDEPCGAS